MIISTKTLANRCSYPNCNAKCTCEKYDRSHTPTGVVQVGGDIFCAMSKIPLFLEANLSFYTNRNNLA